MLSEPTPFSITTEPGTESEIYEDRSYARIFGPTHALKIVIDRQGTWSKSRSYTTILWERSAQGHGLSMIWLPPRMVLVKIADFNRVDCSDVHRKVVQYFLDFSWSGSLRKYLIRT